MATWKILVVDDSRLNREIIAAFLEDGPYTLEMAHDGVQALNLLAAAEKSYDLGIIYAQKSQLKREDRWEEEVSHRLTKLEYTNKKAAASFSRHANRIVFTITDQGQGFDWKQYLEFDPARAFDPNDRGHRAARLTHTLKATACLTPSNKNW